MAEGMGFLRSLTAARSTWLVLLFTVVSMQSCIPAWNQTLPPSTEPEALSDTITRISVAHSPTDIAITPNGAFAYVTHFFGRNLSKIDTATNRVVAVIKVTSGPLPGNVAIATNGTVAYVAGTDREVSIIDIATNTVKDTVRLDWDPWAVATAPNGRFGYVSHFLIDQISEFDTNTNEVTARIPVRRAPFDMAFATDSRSAYLLGVDGLLVLDLPERRVSGPLQIGSGLSGVTVSPNRGLVFVANREGILLLEAGTNTVVATIPLAGFSQLISSPDGRFVYAASHANAQLAVIDVNTKSLIRTIAVPQRLSRMAITPDGNRIYGIDRSSDSVFVVDVVKSAGL